MKRLFTLFFGLAILPSLSAQTIWSSGSLTFTKTAPFQEDCITAGTCLTRGAVSVLYNEVTEDYLDGDGDCDWTPGTTTWAYGNIADWSTLTYENLYELNGCAPPSMVNQPMVLHIMPDNIYLQLTFTFWGSGSGGGGNYTYTRTTQSPLGIKLNTFEVKQNGSKCLLGWTTASEKNNKGFYVERSTDAQHYEVMDFVAAKAGADRGNSYAYTDTKPHDGINYYRLKQVDFNGAYDYSWVVNTTVKATALKVYPNPATNILHFETPETTSGTWKLTNTIGAVLKSGKLSDRQVNISELPSGMYILSVANGQNVNIKNIVKL